MPLYPCTQTDFERFYPVKAQQMEELAIWKENGGLYCLDWANMEFDLYGSKDSKDWNTIDIEAHSCLTHASLFSEDEDDDTEGATDRKETSLYLFDAKLVLYYNRGRFLPAEFASPVEWTSIFKSFDFD